jgi:hypothetical protein
MIGTSHAGADPLHARRCIAAKVSDQAVMPSRWTVATTPPASRDGDVAGVPAGLRHPLAMRARVDHDAFRATAS